MNTILDILGYFFYPIPGSKFNYYVPVLIIAAILTILSITLKYYLKRHKENKSLRRLFHGLPHQIFWVVAFLLLNMFGRYERFPLLGARFVLYITTLAGLYVLGKSIYTYVKIYPKERVAFKETPAQKKYTTGKHRR